MLNLASRALPAGSPTDTLPQRRAQWSGGGSAGVEVFLIGLFVLLVVVRIPQIFTVGRFWAEESVVYFFAAWNQPWTRGLFASGPGYVNLAASGAAELARNLVTVEQAPRVTAAIALILQTLPAVLLATSRFSWLKRSPAYAAALLLLLIPAGDAEIWLNSITSQFHLALCVALILAADTRDGGVGVLRSMILVLAPLSGPVVGAIAPLFLLRALFDRSWARLLQTVLLGTPMLLQVTILLAHSGPGRGGVGPLLMLAIIAIEHVILPFAGAPLTARISRPVILSFLAGGVPVLILMVGAFGMGALGAALWRWGDRATCWLFAAGLILAIASYSGAITAGSPINLLLMQGNRYSYAPTVIFSLCLLALTGTGPLVPRAIAFTMVVWMIVVGARTYFMVPEWFAQGPNWSAEVAAWRIDPTHEIMVWPRGPQWKLDLTPDPSGTGR